MRKQLLLFLLCLAGWGAVAPAAVWGDEVPLQFRRRVLAPDGRFEVVSKAAVWDLHKTAIIVCDMWDAHHCLNAVLREKELAPRMNALLVKARSGGALIIHAPSSCMAPYANHPARRRAQDAPKAANLPKDISEWCRKIPAEEKGVYPLDQDDGGCDTEPAAQKEWEQKLKAMGRKPGSPWLAQIDVIKIENQDAISDSGVEIWNLLEQRGIKHVMLVGVHTNMCVLGRPFGLRQLAKNGRDVVLVRDMTDTMYNPKRWPYVSHFQGTDLIVQHIEKYVCATITSDQLLGGVPFRYQGDVRPNVVIAIAEPLYDTKITLPKLARDIFAEQLGLKVTVLHGKDNNIPGLAKALATADLLVLSVRRQALPTADIEALKKYLDAGKPLLALRTSSHAFDAKGKVPPGHAEWVKFDADVLGGNYHNHHPEGPITTVTMPGEFDHVLFLGIDKPFKSKGALYKTSPLAKTAQMLMTGEIPGQPPEPVVWTNEYGKARVFYTSLGHREDFQTPQFVTLLHNAARWLLQMPHALRTGKGS